MHKVEWIGQEGFEEYHGTAGDADGIEVHLYPGKAEELSEAQAAYLEVTFPGLVAIEGKKTQRPKRPKVESADEPAE